MKKTVSYLCLLVLLLGLISGCALTGQKASPNLVPSPNVTEEVTSPAITSPEVNKTPEVEKKDVEKATESPKTSPAGTPKASPAA